MRPRLSIRQRTVLGFALMILLVSVASGMGLLYSMSVERTINAMRSGAEQLERTANLRQTWLAIAATIDNILLTRQTSLIERQLNGEIEELNRQLDALQAQSWGESTEMIAQNREIVNNLQILGNNLSHVTNELSNAVRKGQWARAQFLHHNDLASSERLFNENLDQLSTNVRSDVDASITRSLRTENLLQTYWIATVLAALVAGSIAAFLTFSSILRPISTLVAAAQAVRNGNLSQRATVSRRDELGVLADAFNSMTLRLEQTIKELRTSEENYRGIFENAVEGIYQTSLEGQMVSANPALAHILGYDSAEELAASLTDIRHQLYVHPEDRDTFLSAIVERGTVLGQEFQFYRKDGQIVWVSLNARMVRDETDVPRFFEGFITDITAKKKAEDELRKHRDHLEELVQERTAEIEAKSIELSLAKDAAEAANRAKSAFLSTMSHELRTPLNGILGYTQILKRSPDLTPLQRNGLNIIQQSGDHLLTLINDILDLSKIEARKLELYPTDFNLDDFLQGVSGIISLRAQNKGLNFALDVLPPLPEGVYADEKRLRQVLINLLSNAVKFTERGSVTLCMQEIVTPRTTEGVKVLRFAVIDTGIGVPEEQLEKIFVPFEQTEAGKKQTEGAGLGLAISRQIVQMMESDLQVTSTVGQGSTFWFDVAVPVAEVHAREVATALQDIIGYTGPQRKILLADDKEHNRALLRNILAPLGFEIIEAEDGQIALHLAQQTQPDVMIVDTIMPGLTGFEAVQQLRALPAFKDTIIFGCSASLFDEDAQKISAVGYDAFLPKPVEIKKLLGLLQEYLHLEWRYAGAPPQSAPPLATLVAPPQAELATLYELAKIGNMRGIRTVAGELVQQDAVYQPFADKLLTLARAFQKKQIVALVEQYLEEK